MVVHKFIFLGPLGWKKNIWNKVVTYLEIDEKQDAVFFEFPGPTENIASYITSCKAEINKYDNCIFIAASYGGLVLLSILKSVTLNIDGIILIEPSVEVLEYEQICEILKNRKYQFKDYSSFLDSILEEKEKEDSFFREVVKATFCFDRNEHFMSNNELKSWIQFFNGKEPMLIKQMLSRDNIKKNHIYILCNDDSKFNQCEAKVEKITAEDHLLMLTKPKYLASVVDKCRTS